MIGRSGLFIVVTLAACGTPAAPRGTGRVRLATPGARDTVRFDVPVLAQRCAGGGGILVSGAREGQGMLLLIRSQKLVDTGAYNLLTRADSTAERGAIVAIRFSVGPVSHGLTVDDGTARVTQATPTLAVEARGRGLETGSAAQRTAEVTVDHVPFASDSAFCRVQP